MKSEAKLVVFAVNLAACRPADNAPTDITPAVPMWLIVAGLDDGAIEHAETVLADRRPILFAGTRIVRDCYARPGLDRFDHAERRLATVATTADELAWLPPAAGAPTLEYEVHATLRLPKGYEPVGAGPGCASVTHLSEFVEIGSGRVLGSTSDALWRSGETVMPLRVFARPVLIRPVAARKLRRHAGPMVRIAGGSWQGERIDPFWLDRWEVSVAAYRECVEAGYCVRPREGRTIYDADRVDQCPMFPVPWREAVTFCAWAGKRLATLREWRWAARGREEGRTYPWGPHPIDVWLANWEPEVGAVRQDLTAELATCDGTGVDPLGHHPLGASRDGVENLSDNVNEWVAEEDLWAGSSFRDDLDFDRNLAAADKNRLFTTTSVGRAIRSSSGIRCAADNPPPDTVAASEPKIRRIDDLDLLVHPVPGLRTRRDAAQYCASFSFRGRDEWMLPSAKVLADIRSRIEISSAVAPWLIVAGWELDEVPYWSTDAVQDPKLARALCVHRGSTGEKTRRAKGRTP